MSRVIKFRWWNGNAMIANKNLGMLAKNLKNNKNGEIMQFTGLQDSEGVDIYEGDIVRCKDWGWVNIDKLICVSVVEWDVDEKGWGLTPDPTDGDRYDLFRNVRVIGNIHENPELLEVER